MDILTLKIESNGFKIINNSGKIVYAQNASYQPDEAWDAFTINRVGKETYNSMLLQEKTNVLAKLSELRYNTQITPIAVKEGYFVPTAENISTLANSIALYTNDDQLVSYTLNWKVSNTIWIEMDIKTANKLLKMAQHQVQSAFTLEQKHFKAISEIETYADLAVYDYSIGWDDVAVVSID